MYHVGEGATLQASVEHPQPDQHGADLRTAQQGGVGLAEFVWNGKGGAGRDVQPGRYRMVLEVTDKAGNVTLQRNALRVMP